MKARLVNGRIVTDIPVLKQPRASRSGKSTLIATTRGPRKAGFRLHGKPVYISFTAYVLSDTPNNVHNRKQRYTIVKAGDDFAIRDQLSKTDKTVTPYAVMGIETREDAEMLLGRVIRGEPLDDEN